MEKSLETKASGLSPVALAWIGDGVYSLYIREYLCSKTKKSINALHKDSVRFVKASAQAHIAHYLKDNVLTEEENDVLRKGRNANTSVPKSSSVSDYHYATGFEALLGWLYLNKNFERLSEILEKSVEIIEN